MNRLRRLQDATRKLRGEVGDLRFAAPVAFVYNPLDYAARPHGAYLRAATAANAPKRVLLLGMNPGPFGMAQTGIPFGEIGRVRDWLGIEAPVGRPGREHPKRPVLGFACPRSEVSGARLWGAIADHFGTPERFFESAFIANYCPLAFLEDSGRNRTPDRLPARERKPLYAACDRHLRSVVRALEPRFVVGVGAFATSRAREALRAESTAIATILHPSPANPRANRDWLGIVRRELRDQKICA